MAFAKCTLLAVIASTAWTYSDAFALSPAALLQTEARRFSCFNPVVSNQRPRPLSVTLSSVDDLVGAADDDEDEDSDESRELLFTAEDLGTAEAESTVETGPSAPYLHNERLQEMRQQYKRHETDTGSPEFQVAGMTERISYLTQHLKSNPKDFSTRRGLVALVNKRRRLLNYLFKEDVDRYADLVKGLGIRHKAPGRVRSREEQYGNFPPQKNPKKHRK